MKEREKGRLPDAGRRKSGEPVKVDANRILLNSGKGCGR